MELELQEEQRMKDMAAYYVQVVDAKRHPCDVPFRCLQKRHIGYGTPPLCDDCRDVLSLAEGTSTCGLALASSVDVPIFLDLIQRCPTLGDFEVTVVPRGATVVSTLQRALKEYASTTKSRACSKALDTITRSTLRIRRLWAIIPKKGGNLPSVLIPALMGTLIFQKESPTSPLVDMAFIERNKTHCYPLKYKSVLWFPYGDEQLLDEFLERHVGLYLHVKSFDRPQGRINISDDGRGVRCAKLRAIVINPSSEFIISEGEDTWGRMTFSDLAEESATWRIDIGNPKQRRLTIGATFQDFAKDGIACPLVSPGLRYFCDYWYLTGFIDLWDSVRDSGLVPEDDCESMEETPAITVTDLLNSAHLEG